jgi:energy-coupling factor transporter transmembrane protein EcfT|tara:strand:+ start:222 stop:899 length:678 start_codon:yes stop_codon:yes gene_type:complete
MAYIQNSAYHLGNSILHSTGARSKILLALACIFVTGTGGGLALVFMFFLCHLGMLVSGIFILDAWKRLAALKILFLVLGVTPLFLTPGAPLYFSSEFSLPITKEGLECSVFTVSRLVCMVWISMILVRTTSPQSLMEIVSGSRSNFFTKSKALQEFVLVGILSFQILPHLLAEAEEKMRACWRDGKVQNKDDRLETLKEMVRSIIMWVVAALANPERLMRRIEKQ